MEKSSVPSVVSSRASSYRRPVRPADRPVAAGDVRRACSGGVERLVMVVRVPVGRDHVVVSPVHPMPEWATESDRVVCPAVSGVGFQVVVQAGWQGCVSVSDLGPLVATVPAPLDGDGVVPGARLCGPFDARSDFKAAELAAFQRLCEAATAATA